MSLERYDEALLYKLKKVYPNTIFSSLSNALGHEADEEIVSKAHDGTVSEKKKKEQKVAVPLIAFDRINNPLNFEFAANDPMIRRGRHIIQDFEVEKIDTREKALPVNLQYQVDILSDRRVEVDGIWRELVMYLYLNPNVEVKFFFENKPFKEAFPIKIMDTDNTTDVQDFSNTGRMYRQTINLEIQQAKLLFIDRVNVVEKFPLRVIELREDGDGDEV